MIFAPLHYPLHVFCIIAMWHVRDMQLLKSQLLRFYAYIQKLGENGV